MGGVKNSEGDGDPKGLRGEPTTLPAGETPLISTPLLELPPGLPGTAEPARGESTPHCSASRPDGPANGDEMEGL